MVIIICAPSPPPRHFVDSYSHMPHPSPYSSLKTPRDLYSLPIPFLRFAGIPVILKKVYVETPKHPNRYNFYMYEYW